LFRESPLALITAVSLTAFAITASFDSFDFTIVTNHRLAFRLAIAAQ
jgi:hypothetical protein